MPIVEDIGIGRWTNGDNLPSEATKEQFARM
jgi:hypothetical protein